MSQKFPISNFEQIEDPSQFNEDLIKKNYNEESDEVYFLEADGQYPENVYGRPNDLSFFPEIMKIENGKKLVANLLDKTEYVIHIRNLKQGLNHALVLKKVNRVIKFNPNAWLKSFIDMNTDLTKKKQKTNMRKTFSS